MKYNLPEYSNIYDFNEYIQAILYVPSMARNLPTKMSDFNRHAKYHWH